MQIQHKQKQQNYRMAVNKKRKITGTSVKLAFPMVLKYQLNNSRNTKSG
jgi:hypothetical protein